MDDNLDKVAMNMILYAGDARGFVHEALNKVRENKIDEALKSLDEANKNLISSHKFQTEVIQKACSGEKYEYNLLFAHAMDTLMTVQSEHEIARDLVLIFEALNKRIEQI